MWKRLGLVFAIQTAVFTVATGYDQLTQGEIQGFFLHKNIATGRIVVLFWVIPIATTVLLEGIYRAGKWFIAFIERKIFSWQLNKRKIPELSQSELLNIVDIASKRGLLKPQETESLERAVSNLNTVDILLLGFLDNPFAIVTHETLSTSGFQGQSYFSLFLFNFPFMRRREVKIFSSLSKLSKLNLIVIGLDEFKTKMPDNPQRAYCTSPIGHKLIFLIRKAPFFP